MATNAEMVSRSAYTRAQNELEESERKRKGLMERVRSAEKVEPAKVVGKIAVGLGSAFSAGATDKALERRGLALPGGVRVSQITGTTAAVVAIGTAFTKKTAWISEWATPVAIAQLAPSAYGAGAGAMDNIEDAVAQATAGKEE